MIKNNLQLTVPELLEVAYALRKNIEKMKENNISNDELEQAKSALEKVKMVLRGE